MQFILSLLFFLCLNANLLADESRQWPSNFVSKFLEPLTYPQIEWRDDDYGIDTSPFEQGLLERYKPEIIISPEGLLPIDFYKDYLPQTYAKNKQGKIIRSNPGREYLKKIERKYGYYLDYHGEHPTLNDVDFESYLAPLYARAFYEVMESAAGIGENKNYWVLKYTAVFSASGLPAKLSWYKKIGAEIIGDVDIWHELDIHGAIHILVDAKTKRPEILLLAQHNHFRSYVIGRDVKLTADGRIQVCFAFRSNEPYPCPPDNRTEIHRTVGNPANFSYVISGEGALLDGSEDQVFGLLANAKKINTVLKYLPDKDPLHVSWISLGDKKKIFGLFSNFYREGPPGINMNTIPRLRKYTDIAKFWYFKDGNEESSKLFNRYYQSFSNVNVEPILNYHGKHLWGRLLQQ